MSDLLKELEARVSPADWEKMVKQANISASELKTKVLDAWQHLDEPNFAIEVPSPKLSEVKSENECQSLDFEISLFKIIGLKGTLTLCGDSKSDWSAELRSCLILAGAEVWCCTYHFDAHSLSICYEPNVGIAKAKLCFKLELGNNELCLNINGNACVWTFGWQCGDFDNTVFCLPF